jgi:hypothetical protein
MSQICEYCDDEHDVSDTVFAIVSHGFGHANKEHKPFCSVVCRTWWRRRCSDDPGAWEQPMQPGYQGRLDRFRDDHDDRDTRSESVSPAVAARPASESGRTETTA